MAERPVQTSVPWQVPVSVDEVLDDGRHFDLVADAETRAAVAKVAGLRDLPRLEAHFDVARYRTDGLRVDGRVLATVGQTCVVTLDPLTNEIAEDVALVFAPLAEVKAKTSEKPRMSDNSETADTMQADWDDEVEPLVSGSIDLGAVATEFLLLGLNPYPRKPGVEFQPPHDPSSDEGPFAALAALKKDGDAH
jgi:uncharacterized metal-binding protein YceD (DUF177 family)